MPASLILLSPIATVVPSALLNNLVAYYSFENLLADVTGRGNNLTDTSGTGSVSQAAGKVGQAASFNSAGSGQRLSGPTGGDFNIATGNYTFALWFKMAASQQNRVLFGKLDLQQSGGYYFIVNQVDKLDYTIYDINGNEIGTPLSSNTGYSDGNWHLAVIIQDLTNNRAGVSGDGGAINWQTLTGTAANNSLAFTIGARSDGGGTITATVDEFLLATRAWGDSDIALFWNGGNGTTWPFVV